MEKIIRYSYTAFGSVLSDSGTFDNEYRYTSQAIDENDLYYMHARYYDKSIGRFTSTDPANSGHSYNYTGGNPTNFTDPSGMMYMPSFSYNDQLCPIAAYNRAAFGLGDKWLDASNEQGLWGSFDDPFE